MSEALFRPRRRRVLRLTLAVIAGAIALSVGAIVLWLRTHIVPPDCSDTDTLAMVRQSLTGRFNLPPGVTIDNIRTLAGGYVAFRFVCQASLGGFNSQDLPPGVFVPGTVHYISRLSADRRNHEVTVSIQPVLIWEQKQ
jgi:hypothetical protein